MSSRSSELFTSRSSARTGSPNHASKVLTKTIKCRCRRRELMCSSLTCTFRSWLSSLISFGLVLLKDCSEKNLTLRGWPTFRARRSVFGSLRFFAKRPLSLSWTLESLLFVMWQRLQATNSWFWVRLRLLSWLSDLDAHTWLWQWWGWYFHFSSWRHLVAMANIVHYNRIWAQARRD